MKYKLKKIWEKHMDSIAFGIAMFVLVGVILIPSWIIHNEEEDTPMESTSEEGIKATSFDYKGHQYILFEENRSFGASSILHNPDCRKCKFAQ